MKKTRLQEWLVRCEASVYVTLTWLEAKPTLSWRLSLQTVVLEKPWFERSVLGLIIVNTAALACDRYPLPGGEAAVLELVNLVLTFVFALEMVLNVLAYGLYHYLSTTENIMDFAIVVTSLVEVAVVPPAMFGGDSSEQGGALTAFRCMRLFRIFKMAKKWKAMKDLMKKFQKTLADVSNVAFLMLLLMYIFALLGMQLFANNLHFNELGFAVKIGDPEWEDAEIPRSNFDSFSWAFITIFQVSVLKCLFLVLLYLPRYSLCRKKGLGKRTFRPLTFAPSAVYCATMSTIYANHSFHTTHTCTHTAHLLTLSHTHHSRC
jgi:hypothetical protein